MLVYAALTHKKAFFGFFMSIKSLIKPFKFNYQKREEKLISNESSKFNIDFDLSYGCGCWLWRRIEGVWVSERLKKLLITFIFYWDMNLICVEWTQLERTLEKTNYVGNSLHSCTRREITTSLFWMRDFHFDSLLIFTWAIYTLSQIHSLCHHKSCCFICVQSSLDDDE